MPAATDRIEFAPPPPPGRARALALAVLAHVLLMLALTWGITWNRESQDMSVEAELWARLPQEAAPRAAQPEPTPPIVQAPPLPPPAPPEPKVEAPPPPAPAKEPDIALEREKRRQEEAQRRRVELEERRKLEARKRQEELEREKKLAEARRKKEEQEQRELAERKAAAEKKKQEELAKAKAKEQQEAKLREAIRQQQIERMRNLASGTGAPTAAGTAARSAGPSDSYAGRIRARVKPNIVFTDDIPGNPTAEIEVRMAPDGTITSKRVVKSSGVSSWDAAVLRALDKTEVLPRDIDGRVHSPLIIEFRPKG
ncbi:MAG: cell envelope integrity protein TolA [Ramlibacter sp.]